MKNTKTTKKVTSKKKGQFNMYAFMNKNKKAVVGTICMILVLSMVIGLFAQFAM